jgi:hypothetical protein
LSQELTAERRGVSAPLSQHTLGGLGWHPEPLAVTDENPLETSRIYIVENKITSRENVELFLLISSATK